MKVVKKIATVLASIVLWCVILLAALYAFTVMATRDESHVASIFGLTPMVVESDSMAPEFYQGDLIFIQQTDPSTLKVGDVVCFHTIIENQYALNTHRIEAIQDNNGVRSYTTKGDNNEISDTHMISDGDIVGKYIGHWSGVGKIMDFLSSSAGFLIVIVLPMLIFFIYQVYHLIMVSINLKKAVALETAESQAAAGADSAEAAKAKEEAAKMLAEAQRLREEAAAMKADAAKGQGTPTQAGTQAETTENPTGTQPENTDEKAGNLDE